MPDMRESKTISIIIPTFNSESHIRQCLERISVQTFGDYEIIIVDGVSTDRTLAIVEEYATSHPDMSFIIHSERDQGIYDAMNKGIHLSQGTWLYFSGADDYFLTEDILATFSLAFREGLEIVYGDVQNESDGLSYDGAFDVEKLMTRNICHQAIFYRRTIFEKMGNFDLTYTQEADYAFNLKCWLSRDTTHLYVNKIVAFFGGFGISSAGRDTQFIKDYPRLVQQYINSGHHSRWTRITYTSILFRKILLRYSLSTFFSAVAHRPHILSNVIATLMVFPNMLRKKNVSETES